MNSTESSCYSAVYNRTGRLAVTGSNLGNFFIFLNLVLVIIYLVSFLELIWVWVRIRSGLVLVVFPPSGLCLLHENGNRLVLEMVSTVVGNDINCCWK